MLLRKLSAIFLLAVFFVSSNSIWILDAINHHQMRAKIAAMRRSGKDYEDLEQLVFSDKEFGQLHFEDDGQELELAGKMYDIIKVKQLPGKKIIYCLRDNKETHLKLLAKNQGQHKNLRYKNTISKIYIPSGAVGTFVENGSENKKYLLSFLSEHLCTVTYDIVKPPPDLS